ncbi:MAG TPA: hypothetical protein VMZ27_01765, partial [Candidatus Saccharimonadales bacterium]|nr:hypothetical protein [Candidatus Saccharimonadales bacterium]
MSPSEVALHWRKKFMQATESVAPSDLFVPQTVACFPALPSRKEAPADLLHALRRKGEAVIRGTWTVFGNREIQVDDPPNWSYDYLSKVNVSTPQAGSRLNHRQLPGKADVKLVWELSRWHELTRLAQAGWLLEERCFAEKTLDWLESWVTSNPPGIGWNWTSALESGLRLIQFTWIDALITAGIDFPQKSERLNCLRHALLGPHARFTWRYRSFGSSANNHLIGELAGLIIACVRWPGLDRYAVPLQTLAKLWEGEVLAQFELDGGNR